MGSRKADVVEASLKSLFEEAKDLEFPEVVNKVHAFLYELYEGQRNKTGKFTAELMSTTRKCFDFIGFNLVRAHRDYVASEAKLKTFVSNSKAYEALAEKFSRSSGLSVFPQRAPDLSVKPLGEPSFSVVVSSSGDKQINEIKRDIKSACRSGIQIPLPDDVVTTKTGQLIFKVKSKADSLKIKETFDNLEGVKENIRVTVPKRRLKRILILSVDPDVEEDSVRGSLSGFLRSEGYVGGENDDDAESFEIVKQIQTRSGKVNWLVGVEKDISEVLIKKKRICIDMERYRVVHFIPIIRCFNCQSFGHTAMKCGKDTKCVRCAGSHTLKDCSVTEVACSNCLFSEDTDIDSSHRADSPDCPSFLSYRAEMLNKRL